MEGGQDGLLGLSMSSLSQELAQDKSWNLMMRMQGEAADQEGEPVVYSFYAPEVRRRLMKMIKTDVIRIMDKKFMNNLQEKLHESYHAEFDERLRERRKKEAERRKKLALKGVQPLGDNSLDQHPIILVSRQVEKDVEQWKRKNRKPHIRPHADPWEYRQFLTLSELESEKSEVSPVNEEIADRDWVRACERRLDDVRREALEIGVLPAQEIIENLRYEPPLVKELRQLHTVEELYQMAEQILSKGPSISGDAEARKSEEPQEADNPQ